MSESRWARDGVAAAHVRSFGRLCAGTYSAIVEQLPPSTGLLADIGCGDGALADLLRTRGHRVVALDADAAMIAHTTEFDRTAGARHSLVGALPSLPLTDACVQGVVANFVVNHLDDPRAGMRDLRRVVAPGGRLVTTIWPGGGAGWSSLVGEAFDRGGAEPFAAARLSPERDFERSTQGLAGIAAEGGWDVVTAQDVEWNWQVRPSDLWAGVRGGVATPGARYLAQSPETRADVDRAFAELAARLVGPDGRLTFPCRAVLVAAEAPD